MLIELLAEELVRQRQAQSERDAARAQLLREVARDHRPRWARLGARLHAVRRAAAAGAAQAGGWLVRAGTWLQSVDRVPAAAGPPC